MCLTKSENGPGVVRGQRVGVGGGEGGGEGGGRRVEKGRGGGHETAHKVCGK